MPTKKPSGRRRGAQPGNTNALKSGRRSKRLKKLVVALMSDPEIRGIVLALATAQESDDIRRFDHTRLLFSIAGLKQSIRRYAALVDGSHRSRVLDSLGLPAGFPPGNVEAAGPDVQSTASTAKPSMEHGPQSAQPAAKLSVEHGPQSAQPTAKPTEGWPRTNTPKSPSPDTAGAHFSQTNDASASFRGERWGETMGGEPEESQPPTSATLPAIPPTATPGYNALVTRTLLFDVDQTLLYTGGAGGLAMARAFHPLYGVEDAFQAVEGSGRTDWNILKRGLELHDLLDGTPIEELLPNFIDVYLEHLPATLRDTPGGHIKPGVPELLDALASHVDVRLGLATGNFKRACLLKLAFFKLDAHLHDGGFGEDAEDRGEMVAKAIERVTNESTPSQVWVIGDTPRDVEAARANGARSLAVATGTSSVDDLLAAGADVALEDLSDTEAVLSVLLE